MQTTIPRPAAREATRLMPPKEWEQLFTDAPLVEALANYTRLNAERGKAHQAELAAEAALRTAALADRDDLAAAIHAGAKPPKSDLHAARAAAALSEAARQKAATQQAYALAADDLARVVGERRTPVLADLAGRITSAEADARDALAQLDAALDALRTLRAGRQFIQTRGRQSNWTHPHGLPARHLSELADMIEEPSD